jgi:hypothetical protein
MSTLALLRTRSVNHLWITHDDFSTSLIHLIRHGSDACELLHEAIKMEDQLFNSMLAVHYSFKVARLHHTVTYRNGYIVCKFVKYVVVSTSLILLYH